MAHANIERAGFAQSVDLKESKALDIIPDLCGLFDLIFIDADKSNNPEYIRGALRLSRPGAVIVGDKVRVLREHPRAFDRST